MSEIVLRATLVSDASYDRVSVFWQNNFGMKRPLDPFKAPESIPIIIPSNLSKKTGFPAVEAALTQNCRNVVPALRNDFFCIPGQRVCWSNCSLGLLKIGFLVSYGAPRVRSSRKEVVHRYPVACVES